MSNQKTAKQHILFGNNLLLQITHMLGMAAPGMQCACFVAKASAPPEQIVSFFHENFLLFQCC